ncbi:MAG: type III-B CRISPR-associated protein Cas10/Cmr2 [Flavobacteriaceae bacterium]|nr:MAG: type III-B CRISPR-associated protein Cas10/Cmr2 [Flavobacteriaceae bacterium]
MSNQHYLHFTLGPVQGFVSQARRTRDFWAGSFLLSWLTAKAMAAVQDAGGKIVMPAVEGDALLKMVRGEPLKDGEKPPKIGSLPNNFIAQVPEGFDGNVAVNAVQDAWKALADAVWKEDKLEDAGVRRDLWDEQIENFWDMAWVVADSDDAAVLAMRKNWRTYMPPESQGDKCTMMGEWQELSGADRPKPSEQKVFWRKVKDQAGISDIELRENERLCAIAYVKRRFVHVWQSFEGHRDWELPTAVPSTSYMAAVHWLEQVLEHGDKAQIKAFHDAGKAAVKGYGEWGSDIPCITDKVDKKGLAFRFTSLDGRIFFKSSLENSKEFKAEQAKPALDALHGLTQIKTQQQNKLGHPSPFYAVLMMDGDNLGKTKEAMVQAKQSPTALSKALGEFTKEVPKTVKDNNGFLIYAGGDDVLALLPLEDALPCAAEVREKYMQIFKDKGLKDEEYSISAAIEYAHMKLPLTMILKDAHKLLDDIAKDATGRDAVACRVWKPGGEQQTWAMPWDISEEAKATDMLDLVHEMEQRAENKSDVGYSSKLLYSFRETLNAVIPDELPDKMEEVQTLAENIKALQLDKLLEATYMSSGLLDGWKEKDEGQSKLAYVREQIKKLMPLMRVYNKQGEWEGLYSSDGALLLRFLAQKGVER